MSAKLFEQLSHVATATPGNAKDAKLKKRKSPFFFKLDDISDELLRQKELTEKPVLPQSNKVVVDRSESFTKELPGSIEPSISKVREFFLKEISPLLIAANAGVNQAKNVIEHSTGSSVDDTTENFFNQMLIRGVNIRLSRFIVEYLGLTEDDANELIHGLNVKREMLVLPCPEPEHPVRGITDEEKAKYRQQRSVRPERQVQGANPISRASRRSPK